MNKKVLITVSGFQRLEGQEQDDIELITEGVYSYRNGRGMLRYEESEITGMAGTTTQFSFTSDEVVISRKGTTNSRMAFVEGDRKSVV